MNFIPDEINYPKQIIKIAENVLGKLLGPAISESGQLIADKIRSYRFKNQVKVLNDVSKLLEDNGLSPRQIPIKLIVPLLENASLEENISLQKMWTRLIMNASTSDYKVGLHKVCIEILNNLSSAEAIILEKIKKQIIEEKEKEKFIKISGKKIRYDFKPSSILYASYHFDTIFSVRKDEAEYIIDNLIRLGIFKWSPSDIEDNELSMDDFICLTNLGYSFLKETTDLMQFTS